MNWFKRFEKNPRFGEEEKKNVEQVLKSGRLSEYFKNPKGGPWVQEFERKFADYHKVPYAIACSNGTTALQIALQAVYQKMIEKKPDADLRTVVTPYSFIASATAPMMAGGNPYFIDVDEETYTIPSRRDKGNYIPEDIQVILPVHLLGHPADMNHLMKDHSFEWKIVEDTAQALGARYEGKLCGTFGQIATYSLQYTKTITSGGEGGMIITPDEELYEACMNIRSHGSQYGDYPHLSYNFRMTELQAAFGCAQFDRLPKFLGVQIRNAMYIRNHLPAAIKPWKVEPNTEPTHFLIGCSYDEKEAVLPRDEFIKAMERLNISQGIPGKVIGPGYSLPLYKRPVLRAFAPQQPLPNVEGVVQKALWLDIHRWRSLEEVKKDLEVIQKVLQ